MRDAEGRVESVRRAKNRQEKGKRGDAMKHTSAEAAKLLRKLNEELDALEDREQKSAVFIAAVGERLEDARPEYDYRATQERRQALESQIRKLKHAINLFNVSTNVPGFDMTVDQLLVYIPQLSAKKRRLAQLASNLPKERVGVSHPQANRAVIEYRHANYDLDDVANDLADVTDELAKAQNALDVVNTSVPFELEM